MLEGNANNLKITYSNGQEPTTIEFRPFNWSFEGNFLVIVDSIHNIKKGQELFERVTVYPLHQVLNIELTKVKKLEAKTQSKVVSDEVVAQSDKLCREGL